MSINIYLNTKKLENHKDFETTSRTDKGNKWDNYQFLGSSVFGERGKYYIISHEIEEDLSASIEEMVEEISFHGSISLHPKRITGAYTHKSATATVDVRKENYIVEIRGKRMEDVRELYHLIRAGKIQPKESWEEEQTGKGIVPLVLRMFRK